MAGEEAAAGDSGWGGAGPWATIISSSFEGLGSGMQAGASKAAGKKQAKEMKRATLADMLNKALGRELDLYKFTSEQGGINTGRRAAALQETANSFIRALTGR